MADTATKDTTAHGAHGHGDGHGDHGHGHGDHEHHVVSVQFLAGILGALLCLTALTVWTAQHHLGDLNVPLAMLIATTKATLVALFFMHLKWDKPFNSVILLMSLGFVGLFLGIATLDLGQVQGEMIEDYAAPRMERLRQEQGITFGEHGEGGEHGGGAEHGGAPAPAGRPQAELEALVKRVNGQFQLPLPDEAKTKKNPLTPEKIALGRMLYYDARLSKNHDVSCNSCHRLDGFGVDNEVTSPGHKKQRGTRNSPTVLNAAFQSSQFWDSRAASVEEQAQKPITNPVEMAMKDDDAVIETLTSIPGYVDAFTKAFPDARDPITMETVGQAIGAFERKLVTNDSPFDKFAAGDLTALTPEQVDGLELYLEVGCAACHMGPLLGGTMNQKLGLVKPYPSKDEGRYEVTENLGEKFFFKVPQLRNVAKTAPYLHDGSLSSLGDTVKMMAEYQLGKQLSDGDTAKLVAFMESLTGSVNAEYVKPPALPESGPTTPKPDPN